MFLPFSLNKILLSLILYDRTICFGSMAPVTSYTCAVLEEKHETRLNIGMAWGEKTCP